MFCKDEKEELHDRENLFVVSATANTVAILCNNVILLLVSFCSCYYSLADDLWPQVGGKARSV